MAIARYLVDKSAIARFHHPAVATRLGRLIELGLVASCGVIEAEVLFSARNATELEQIRADRQVSYEWLITEDADWQRVLDLQLQLAGKGRLRGVPIPDLLIAAVAERHRVTVLHYDSDFDLIADITGQPTEWVVPSGTVS